MGKYHNVSVELIIQVDGSTDQKKAKELYLVDAHSITEAEARVYKYFENVVGVFKAVSTTQSKIIDVIDGHLTEGHYFDVVAEIVISAPDDEKTKTTKENYLIRGLSPTDVETKMKEYFKNSTFSFDTTSIKKSRIVDIIEPESNS